MKNNYVEYSISKKKEIIVIKTQILKLMHNGGWKRFIDSVIQEGCNVLNTKKTNGYTLLSCATEYGDKEILEYLMRNGAKSNATNFDGSVPLHVAARHGHHDLVKLFIHLSVGVDCQDYLNRTPLHYVTDQFYEDKKDPPVFISGYDKEYSTAVMAGVCSYQEEHTEIVSLLLSHGAEIDAPDSKGNVPLYYAVRHSCTRVVEMLIRGGANVNEFLDDDKWAVLHYASYFGWMNVVRCLVAKNVNLNAETLRGDTPLILAAKRSHKEIVELLVKSGADVTSRGMLKMTALHFASKAGWRNAVKLLVECKADINARSSSGATPVMLAVKHSNFNIFDYLFKQGADLVGCEGKKTILHYACIAGWSTVVQSLVDRGADIDAQTREGDTPLLIAAISGKKQIFDILMKAGASINICNLNSNRLLNYVCMNGWIDIVQHLLDAGLDINTTNLDGSTHLRVAAEFNNIGLFNFLLEAGADVEVKDSRGWTALHEVCARGSLSMVSALLSKGADVHAQSHEGITPLHIAAYHGKLDIVIRLLDAGTDVNSKAKDSTTPLYYAVLRRHLEVAAHLLNFGANWNEDNFATTAFEFYIDADSDLEHFPVLIQHGAFITNDKNHDLMKNSYFKEKILRNVEVCTQAILNKFNNFDLQEIYRVPFAAKTLPPIKRMTIGGDKDVVQCVKESVIRDINTNGFCNLTLMQPIVLSFLAVKSFLKHYAKNKNGTLYLI